MHSEKSEVAPDRPSALGASLLRPITADDTVVFHEESASFGAAERERLVAAGLEAGDAPERLNLDRPEVVHGLHESYVNAGSDIVLTNTFGGSAYRLKLHKLDDRVIEINREAARHARHVVDQLDRRVLVAGSIGPTGELLAPLTASCERSSPTWCTALARASNASSRSTASVTAPRWPGRR